MPACSAFGCTHRPDRDRTRGITFHKFPSKDEVRQQWIKAIRRENFIPSKWSVVCSAHFKEEDLDRTSKSYVRLREGAVPTIFDSFPPYLQTWKKIRKAPTERYVYENELDSATPETPDTETPSCSTDSPEIRSLKRKLETSECQKESYRKKVKVLLQTKRRLMKKNAELKDVILDLKKKNVISTNSVDILEKCSGGVSDLLKRKARKLGQMSLPVTYSPELRSFALTLYFYSPMAYRYVRKTFDTCLPHPKTISKWYRNVDGTPGFTKSAFSFLKGTVELLKSQGTEVLCSLMMDEMAIRQQVEYDGNKYHGQVDLGTELDDDSLPVATEALTFMVVSLNKSWKLPVGYFLLNGLSGVEKKSLVSTCIEKLHEVGVEIVSLTHDGSSSNVSMLKALGVTIEICDQMKHYFLHPVTNNPVYVFLDACHMLKLVRNTFAEKKSLAIENDFIKWEYIELLHRLQKSEGLHLGNKLRSSHVLWFKKKMNVKLAAQTLSDSVASSLEFCLTENISGFEGCEATIKFLHVFNCLFDILNSRNFKSCGWKSPIHKQNFERVENFLLEARNYILSLKESFNGPPLVASRRKTGFIGIVLCIDSVISLFKKLIRSDKYEMKFLLTYKFSQDHIELFFGKVRSMGGHNNNPTARQFSRAYKHLLTHNEIMDVTKGNCLPLEYMNILTTSSVPSVKNINESFARNRMFVQDESNEMDNSASDAYMINYNQLSACSEKIVAYIAGFVVFKLRKIINCDDCLKALIEDDLSPVHSLIAIKNMGGLSIPSKDVVDICLTCERHFRKYVASGDDGRLSNTDCNKLLQSVLKAYVSKPIFSTIQTSHMLDQEGFRNHLILLIKSIAEKYLQVRYFYAGKVYTAKLKERLSCKSRQTLNKLILFSGQ